MKLLRWAVAGASVYAVYKYSIGRKAKGEDVLVNPERAIADLSKDEPEPEKEPAPPAKPKHTRAKSAKGTKKQAAK